MLEEYGRNLLMGHVSKGSQGGMVSRSRDHTAHLPPQVFD